MIEPLHTSTNMEEFKYDKLKNKDKLKKNKHVEKLTSY